MATRTRLTLDEFLSLPETEPPSELIHGEVVQKMSPNLRHGLLAAEIAALLRQHLRQTREGIVAVEVRHVAEGRAYVPDVHVTLAGRVPASAWRGGAIESPPDLAIEVLSPDDTASRTLERIDFYIRIGIRLVWIADPEAETVAVYRPGQPPAVHRAPEAMDAAPVLQGFRIDLAALFAVLRQDG